MLFFCFYFFYFAQQYLVYKQHVPSVVGALLGTDRKETLPWNLGTSRHEFFIFIYLFIFCHAAQHVGS